jgi:hypothetical protein
MIGTLAISAVVATAAVITVDRVRRKARREHYIRTFMFPRGVFDKLLAARPGLAPKDLMAAAAVAREVAVAVVAGAPEPVEVQWLAKPSNH